MRTPIRTLARTGLSIAAVLTLATTPLLATPVAALEGEPIVIRAEEGARIERDYGAMPIADTAGVLTHPGDCALSPGCTEIPLTVELPDDFDPETDEFFFNFLGEWEGNQDLGSAGSQDLDFYIWTLRPDEDGEEEYVEVGSAASASEPERTRLFNFIEGEYVICVVNFLGVNTGFRITLDYVDASIPDDFDPRAGVDRPSSAGGSSSNPQSGSSDTGSSGSGSSPSNGSTPFDFSPTAPAPSSPASLAPTAGGPGGFGLGFTATPGEAGLGDFGSFNEFQKDLNSGVTESPIDLLAASRRQLGPAEPVGAPILLFWLLALPLAAGAGALVFVMRRRPAALTVAT